MTTYPLSDARRDPAKRGEIKFQQNGQSAGFPAKSYEEHKDVILDFNLGNPNDGTWEGIIFYVEEGNLGKDVAIPGNGAHFQATIGGEDFSALEGTVRISKDEVGQTYYGTLSAKTIGSSGTRILVEEGIFSLSY